MGHMDGLHGNQPFAHIRVPTKDKAQAKRRNTIYLFAWRDYKWKKRAQFEGAKTCTWWKYCQFFYETSIEQSNPPMIKGSEAITHMSVEPKLEDLFQNSANS